MKRIKINSFLKLGFLAFAMALIGSSCVKSRDGFTDFSNLSPNVLIPEGGMTNFNSGALLFPPTDTEDTAHFHLNYAATDVAPQDLTITIGIDQAALAAYNASGAGLQYEIFPDSIFKFETTTVTIPKGASYSAAIPLIVYPDKIDLLKNYMLPISISVAPAGSSISANYKTIYYHLIGNPIAGVYSQEWQRWDAATNAGAPTYDQDVSPGIFAPQDGETITTASGTGVTYIVTFTDNGGGNLTDFAVAFDPADIKANGITVTAGPKIVTADPATGTYEFTFSYLNGSGKPRVIIDKYHK